MDVLRLKIYAHNVQIIDVIAVSNEHTFKILSQYVNMCVIFLDCTKRNADYNTMQYNTIAIL